jgi:hypothetical protein
MGRYDYDVFWITLWNIPMVFNAVHEVAGGMSAVTGLHNIHTFSRTINNLTNIF